MLKQAKKFASIWCRARILGGRVQQDGDLVRATVMVANRLNPALTTKQSLREHGFREQGFCFSGGSGLDQQQQQHAARRVRGVFTVLGRLLIRMIRQVLHIHTVDQCLSTF